MYVKGLMSRAHGTSLRMIKALGSYTDQDF